MLIIENCDRLPWEGIHKSGQWQILYHCFGSDSKEYLIVQSKKNKTILWENVQGKSLSIGSEIEKNIQNRTEHSPIIFLDVSTLRDKSESFLFRIKLYNVIEM